MIYGFWLDGFSFWAFLFFLGVATGVWIGVAHGAQIEALFTKFRPEPKVTPEMARGVLFEMRDRAQNVAPLPEGADHWDVYGVADGKYIKLNDKA